MSQRELRGVSFVDIRAVLDRTQDGFQRALYVLNTVGKESSSKIYIFIFRHDEFKGDDNIGTEIFIFCEVPRK